MKNNKVYMPCDALAGHEDFTVWYSDGSPFLELRGAWKHERDKVAIFGRMGGEMGCIKSDAKALSYYLRLERWEYVFHTRRIFEDYYVDGMHWQIHGSLNRPPLDFMLEEEREKNVLVREKDVHVRLVDFLDRGRCFEIKARDVAKLRIAVAAVIAMGIKEEYRGLSEGTENTEGSRIQRMKTWLSAGKGKTYEELQREQNHL